MMNKKFTTTHLFENETFCNIINVFTVTIGQFNAYLLNLSFLIFFLNINIWTLV